MQGVDPPCEPCLFRCRKLHMAVELSTAKAEIKALEEQGTTSLVKIGADSFTVEEGGR